MPLVCYIECCPTPLPAADPSTIYCFKKANYDEIRDHLSNNNIINMFDQSKEDVNTISDRFYDILYDLFDKFVLKATIRSTK